MWEEEGEAPADDHEHFQQQLRDSPRCLDGDITICAVQWTPRDQASGLIALSRGGTTVGQALIRAVDVQQGRSSWTGTHGSSQPVDFLVHWRSATKGRWKDRGIRPTYTFHSGCVHVLAHRIFFRGCISTTVERLGIQDRLEGHRNESVRVNSSGMFAVDITDARAHQLIQYKIFLVSENRGGRSKGQENLIGLSELVALGEAPIGPGGIALQRALARQKNSASGPPRFRLRGPKTPTIPHVGEGKKGERHHTSHPLVFLTESTPPPDPRHQQPASQTETPGPANGDQPVHAGRAAVPGTNCTDALHVKMWRTRTAKGFIGPLCTHIPESLATTEAFTTRDRNIKAPATFTRAVGQDSAHRNTTAPRFLCSPPMLSIAFSAPAGSPVRCGSFLSSLPG
ncbi:hypothetical protein OE88DRAFT_1644673 [Heliocybe sulcata]|uniref:Uncharacterized protein n=1 Tax=Heliocybe sulcata TaxID=5364 RepID=A0A5C3N3A4_9AGAM|nr:hypothetical protein OE88DRAFT_1644673 [Heliocybe sulcata]